MEKVVLGGAASQLKNCGWFLCRSLWPTTVRVNVTRRWRLTDRACFQIALQFAAPGHDIVLIHNWPQSWRRRKNWSSLKVSLKRNTLVRAICPCWSMIDRVCLNISARISSNARARNRKKKLSLLDFGKVEVQSLNTVVARLGVVVTDGVWAWDGYGRLAAWTSCARVMDSYQREGQSRAHTVVFAATWALRLPQF